MHRLKADESYVIGKGQFSPLEHIYKLMKLFKLLLKHNVNMIHPGYGFLSENSEFARKLKKMVLFDWPFI